MILTLYLYSTRRRTLSLSSCYYSANFMLLRETHGLMAYHLHTICSFKEGIDPGYV